MYLLYERCMYENHPVFPSWQWKLSRCHSSVRRTKDSWYMINTAAVLPGSYNENVENFCRIHTFVGTYMGGGTGPADPATTGPMFAVWCLKSQQMWSLHADNQLLARRVSLIVGLKQTMEFLCKANGTASSFFCPFPLFQTSEKTPLLQVRLLASYM